MDNIPAIDILGVRVACVDRAGLLQQVGEWVADVRPERPFCVTYVYANCLNIAVEKQGYQGALQAMDLVYADGIGVVWAGRVLAGDAARGGPDRAPLQKLTGADWFGELCQQAAAKGWRIFFLGGQPGVAERAAAALAGTYPGLHIVGTADGFFQRRSEAEVLAEIRSLQPDILLVGMGVPRQEAWIQAHAEVLPVRVLWGVGALLDYWGGVERRAPPWVQALALEWLWRWALDPAGKWQRNLVGIPKFIGRVLLAASSRSKG